MAEKFMNLYIIIGVILIALGTYLTYYGVQLSSNKSNKDLTNKIEEVKKEIKNGKGFKDEFNNLIKNKSGHINRLHRYQNAIPITGLLIIRQFGSYLTNNFDVTKTGVNIDQSVVIKKFKDYYSNKYKEDPDYSFLKTYFSHVYIIIYYIDSNEFLTPNEKEKYADIFSELLTNEELIILFYHCIYNYDHKKLPGLIKKYHLLQALSENKIIPLFRHYLIENFKKLNIDRI